MQTTIRNKMTYGKGLGHVYGKDMTLGPDLLDSASYQRDFHNRSGGTEADNDNNDNDNNDNDKQVHTQTEAIYVDVLIVMQSATAIAQLPCKLSHKDWQRHTCRWLMG